MPNTYIVGASFFFGVHRLNLFVYALMYLYEIRSYVDISSMFLYQRLNEIGWYKTQKVL